MTALVDLASVAVLAAAIWWVLRRSMRRALVRYMAARFARQYARTLEVIGTQLQPAFIALTKAIQEAQRTMQKYLETYRGQDG